MNIYLRTDRGSGYVWLEDQHQKPLDKANEFLRVLEIRGLSAHTLRAYGYDLLVFYRWLGTVDKKVVGIKVQDLVAFIAAQRQSGRQPHSINRRLTTVQSFCSFCNEISLNANGAPYSSTHYRGGGKDHCLGLRALPPRKHRVLHVKTAHTLVEPLTTNQVSLFLRTLSRHRDLCIVYLMLFCGLRSQEVLQLKMEGVSFTEKQCRVLGKGNKERMLPLPPTVIKAMTNYLNFERPTKNDCQCFFVVLQGARKGQPMTAAGLRTLFRYRRLTPSLSNANAHRWRHTFGTDMARAGSSLPVLQKLMGHSDMRITLQYINLSMVDISQEFTRANEAIQKRYNR